MAVGRRKPETINECAARAVEVLESARARKHMYLLPVDVQSAVNFRTGFQVACFVMGIEVPPDVYELACQERGWTYNALGEWSQMRERGLTDSEIVDELFAVEIAAWKLVGARE